MEARISEERAKKKEIERKRAEGEVRTNIYKSVCVSTDKTGLIWKYLELEMFKGGVHEKFKVQEVQYALLKQEPSRNFAELKTIEIPNNLIKFKNRILGILKELKI